MTRHELIHHIRNRKSFLCIGLDPEAGKLPESIREDADSLFIFCREIVDATRDLCVAYKPNTAFFEQYGSKGWDALERLVDHIGGSHFIIADAKRGDIGNTSTMYARAFFEQLGADAVTLSPYMGHDSVRPFMEFKGKWAVVLALTSNAGSGDFQLKEALGGGYLYEHVLATVSRWGTPENTMFVVGATHPEQFAQIRKSLPDHFLLVPGVGAQGGSLQEVAKSGMNDDVGLLINSSRQIIYAGSGPDFAEASRKEAGKLQQEMSLLLESRIN